MLWKLNPGENRMIVLRNKSFSSKYSSIKKALTANKSATGFINKKIASLGKSASKEMNKITGNSTNTTVGKDGSYLTQHFYESQKRSTRRPKIDTPTLLGFGKGETRGKLPTDPKITKISRRQRDSWVRNEYHSKEIPGKNTKTKKLFVNGSSRVTVDPPRIPGL